MTTCVLLVFTWKCFACQQISYGQYWEWLTDQKDEVSVPIVSLGTLVQYACFPVSRLSTSLHVKSALGPVLFTILCPLRCRDLIRQLCWQNSSLHILYFFGPFCIFPLIKTVTPSNVSPYQINERNNVVYGKELKASF